MRAEFYGGSFDGKILDVTDDRHIIRLPIIPKKTSVFVNPWEMKTTSTFDVEKYQLAVRYPDRLVYLSLQDEGIKAVWLGMRDCDPHVAFFMFREGRFIREIEGGKRNYDLAGWEYFDVISKIEWKQKLRRVMRKNKGKRKSLKKSDPK